MAGIWDNNAERNSNDAQASADVVEYHKMGQRKGILKRRDCSSGWHKLQKSTHRRARMLSASQMRDSNERRVLKGELQQDMAQAAEKYAQASEDDVCSTNGGLKRKRNTEKGGLQ